jgi:hypothetical protein
MGSHFRTRIRPFVDDGNTVHKAKAKVLLTAIVGIPFLSIMILTAKATTSMRLLRLQSTSRFSLLFRSSFGTFSSSATIQEESWQRMNDRTRQLAQDLSLAEHDMDHTIATSTLVNPNQGDDDKLMKSIRFQRRMALARAITLVESKAAAHREQADFLLTYLLNSKSQSHERSFRVGLAGPPGAGKSTLIECFGKYILDLPTTTTVTDGPDGTTLASSSPPFVPEKLAVVCIDPSSSVTGGSILGDKTRMIELSRHERVSNE